MKDYERCAQTLIECVQDERRLIWLNTEGIPEAIRKEQKESLTSHLKERDALIQGLTEKQTYLARGHSFTSHLFVSAEGQKVPRGPPPTLPSAGPGKMQSVI